MQDRRRNLNVILDAELLFALQTHAANANLTLSQATRDLLRHALGVVHSPRAAGWREGYHAAYVEVTRVVAEAVSQVSPVLPGDW